MGQAIRKFPVYMLECPECNYECEIIDSIEAASGSLEANGVVHCPRCGKRMVL